MEGTFEELQFCTEMDLSTNIITSIAAGSFKGLGHLTTLKLQSKLLQNLVEGTFVGLTLCSDLDLSSNSISSIANGTLKD